MNEYLRKSILDYFDQGGASADYLQSLFDMEDKQAAVQSTEEALRIGALSYASQLGTTVYTDVLIAANGYLAFLKGETNDERLKTDEIQK